MSKFSSRDGNQTVTTKLCVSNSIGATATRTLCTIIRFSYPPLISHLVCHGLASKETREIYRTLLERHQDARRHCSAADSARDRDRESFITPGKIVTQLQHKRSEPYQCNNDYLSRECVQFTISEATVTNNISRVDITAVTHCRTTAQVKTMDGGSRTGMKLSLCPSLNMKSISSLYPGR